MISSTKIFSGFPCSHRQPADESHCKYIHGYSRSFGFRFAADRLAKDTCFVKHFGELKWLKQLLDNMFDHTMLVNEDDPEMEMFRELDRKGIVQLRVLPNVGMEATAILVFGIVNHYLQVEQMLLHDKCEPQGRLIRCYEVEVRENEKNSGIFSVNPEELLLNSQTDEGPAKNAWRDFIEATNCDRLNNPHYDLYTDPNLLTYWEYLPAGPVKHKMEQMHRKYALKRAGIDA